MYNHLEVGGEYNIVTEYIIIIFHEVSTLDGGDMDRGLSSKLPVSK